mgnify:FL=1
MPMAEPAADADVTEPETSGEESPISGGEETT